jgi:UDP-glucose 4-epimerase
MNVLVTGGAGYIGSAVVEELQDSGAKVVVLDNLSTGHAEAVPPDVELVCGDIGDRALVLAVCKRARIDAVVHLAAKSLVGESVRAPNLYYETNLLRSLRMLDALITAGVDRVVFSSSAAVYAPSDDRLHETSPTGPTNPYGETKLAFERVLAHYQTAYGLNWTSLRFFNVAGAIGHTGEVHEPETHLIPNVLAVAQGKHEHLNVYGRDYPTEDGTCVRDYVHVHDIARGHVLALRGMRGGNIYNLGQGVGYSVDQVLKLARTVTGHPISATYGPRRAGDPPSLVATHARAMRELGWQPKWSLADTIASAWDWAQANPNGY